MKGELACELLWGGAGCSSRAASASARLLQTEQNRLCCHTDSPASCERWYATQIPSGAPRVRLRSFKVSQLNEKSEPGKQKESLPTWPAMLEGIRSVCWCCWQHGAASHLAAARGPCTLLREGTHACHRHGATTAAKGWETRAAGTAAAACS